MEQRISHDKLPPAGLELINRLNRAGYEAWFVGGCVRDLLLGQTPHDWDICTSALPEETERVLSDYPVHETGIAHGTVLVVAEGAGYEITTFRTEGAYTDHRRPDSVCFVRDLARDLARRDFTINAMAYHSHYGLVDRYDGRDDLQRKLIRAVGDPEQRLQEDALRILRALRFGARLRFTIEPTTAHAIHAHCQDLALVAQERIFEELKGILCSPGAGDQLEAFSDVIGVVLPEVAPLFDFDQNNPHHDSDAWRHTIRTVSGVPAEDVALRLAALLHDTGKPSCCTTDEQGVSHFYGHDQRSAALTHQALIRLRCDHETRRLVEQLVALHDCSLPQTLPAVRRFLAKTGEQTVRKLLVLRRADVLAQSTYQRTEKLKLLDDFEALCDQVYQDRSCWTIDKLAIRGADLIALGMTPGPAVGRRLHQALDAVIEGTVTNDRDALLKYLGFPAK